MKWEHHFVCRFCGSEIIRHYKRRLPSVLPRFCSPQCARWARRGWKLKEAKS